MPQQSRRDSEGGSQHRGKLYDKYTSLIKKLRVAGLRKNYREDEDDTESPG